MSDSKLMGGDDRLKKSDASAVRGDRMDSDASRIHEDGTSMSIEERRRLIRSEWTQDILPTPPKVPGWHFCWLSTTNATDPIYKRVQKGYEPVKASEIPGFQQYTAQEGEYVGCVSCNEMLLFKIPEELYQEIMHIFHYERPMGEEEMLRANAPVQKQDSNGRELGEVEGFETLARKVRPSTFST